MAKRYNLNRIKSLATYSTREIADLLGVHKRTVQQWYREGLPRIDDGKPFLSFGDDLKIFLRKKEADRKRPCKPDEMYCVRCRAPRNPLDLKIKIEILNEKKVIVYGKCYRCGCRLNRIVSTIKLPEIAKILVICRKADKDLDELTHSVVNTDIPRGVS
jgi:excisionase family DNA binding protein